MVPGRVSCRPVWTPVVGLVLVLRGEPLQDLLDRFELDLGQAISLELSLAAQWSGCHPGWSRLDRLTGPIPVHGRAQFLQSLPEFFLVDQVMPRGAGPNRRAPVPA